MTEEKKLTDEELENATGAGPNISASKTSNRGTYGTGQAQTPPSGGETEPNPIQDELLGEVRGGAGYSVSSSKAVNRGTMNSGPTSEESDLGNVGNTDPV